MAKKKINKTNAMRQLDAGKIEYSVYEYPWNEEHLDARHVLEEIEADRGAVYKTIVTVGDKTGITVAVLPALAAIDFKKLAQVSGNKRVELLDLKELEKITGYIRGGCSPIGMKKQFPTFLAGQIDQEEKVLVSAGKRGLQVALRPFDLMKVTGARLADFTAEP